MKSIKAEGRVLGWVVETIKCVNIRTLSFAKKAHTPQIAYKVAVCPRGNLLYMRIYFTNNTNILKGIG